jgi:hypothetical protein
MITAMKDDTSPDPTAPNTVDAVLAQFEGEYFLDYAAVTGALRE